MPRQNGFSHLQFYIQNNEQNCLSLVDTMMSLYWCSHVKAVLAIKANLFHQGKKTINARMANSLLYFFCTIEKEIQKKSESSPNYNRSWFLLTCFFVFFVDRDFWLLRLLLLRSVLILPTTLVRMNALKMGQSRHFAAGVKITAIVFSLLFFTDCVSFLDHFLDESNNNEETLCHEMSITKQTTKSRGEKMQYTRTKEKQWIEK